MNLNRYIPTTIVFTLISLFAVSQSFDLVCHNTDPKITGWKISDGVTTTKYYDDINDETTCTPNIVDSGIEANVQSVYYNVDYIWVEATGCPDYMTGPYNGDGNPSFPGDQARTIVLPRNPVANPGSVINDQSFLGSIGYLLNGVAIFGSGDGMSYNNQGSWWRNATVAENEGFGCDRSHPAMTDLHHHQNPIPFNYNGTDAQSDVCYCFPSTAFYSPVPSQHSPLIGFAIDGYPIYGPYAYTNADGTGGITRMTTSYQLRNITTRTTYADGTTAPNAGPVVSTTWPLGIFYEDFEYISNSGLLDYYNGRFAVTPEYPCGTYAYYATMDDDGNAEFPYFIGLAFYGEISPCEGGAGPPGGGGPPDCSQIPPGAPCCGDGICGGPETAANCPADCGGPRLIPDPDCTVPTDGSVVFFASTGNLPSCNSTVNAGQDIGLDCTTGLVDLVGTGNTGTGTAYSYNWCTPDGNITSSTTLSTITVNAAGTYTYTVIDENGFSVYDTVIVSGTSGGTAVSFSGLPTSTSLTTSIPLTGSPAGGTFSGNGVVFNAFNPSLSGPGIHTITYTYTDANGCTNSTSQDIFVFTLIYNFVSYALGTISPKVIGIEIQTIEFSLHDINIIDINGRILYNKEIFLSENLQTIDIDVDHLPVGYYFLKVSNAKDEVIKTFVR